MSCGCSRCRVTLRSLEPKEHLDLEMPNAVFRWKAMSAMWRTVGTLIIGLLSGL